MWVEIDMDKNYYMHKVALGLVVCIFSFTLLSGCAGTKNVTAETKDPFFEKWRQKAEVSRGYSPSAQKREVDISREKGAISGPAAVTEPEKTLPTKRVTMKMYDVDVGVLIRALARAADQNIMINEKVKGKANINIINAPWDQVFKGILRTHGLAYSWEGDIIRILTVEDMEQDLRREAQERGLKLVEPLHTRIVQVNYAEAKGLKENLEKFLSMNKEGQALGSVMVDEHTNSLIIQALQHDLERMLPLVQELDRPTPQILIEAHIVEATRNTARELGVQWGGVYSHTSSGGNVTHSVSKSGITPTTGYVVNFPTTTDLASMGMTLGYVAENLAGDLLTIQLSALEQEGKLNILSSPSITTVDNQEANIESGSEVPYQTVENGEVKIEYKKAVLSLKVTPHVIGGETLTMNIITKKDELDFENNVAGQPTIITKSAETNVVLRNGETTVIGGLSKEKKGDSEDGVPGLKDVPLLGWFFKGTGKTSEMEDLLIFITPYILEERVVAETQNTQKE